MRRAVSLVLLRIASSTRPSPGCGSAPPHPLGETFSATLDFGGRARAYEAYVPATYSASGGAPLALVLSLHGMGGTSREDACDSGTTAVARDTGAFIAVHPQGLSDIDRKNPAAWTSWHFNGTCQNGGVSCDTRQTPDRYCYASNAACGDCDWTTCADDVGFLEALLDALEAAWCVDRDRVYATGQSNGGMMAYQLGAALSPRLAAIAPISGSLHWGRLVAPRAPIPVLAVTGTNDRTVPANASGGAPYASDGTWWYYTMAGLAAGWRDAQACDGVEAHYATSLDGVDGLWCKTACSNVDHVLCSWSGAHNYFTGPGAKYVYHCAPENRDETYYDNGRLVWEFFSRHTRARDPARAPARRGVPSTTATRLVACVLGTIAIACVGGAFGRYRRRHQRSGPGFAVLCDDGHDDGGAHAAGSAALQFELAAGPECVDRKDVAVGI